ncbi:MAG: hypothetical protein LC118_16640 [Dehalococcoidia bacterium]|nr:hypothetical protein [Dehalococcoidia bacterium]
MLAATLPAAVLFAACSGNDARKQPAEAWVSDVCNLAAAYGKVADTQGERLNDIDPKKDPKGTKETLLSAFSAIEDARAEFSKGLEKAGEPDLKSGHEVVGVFKSHDETSKKKLLDTRKAIEKLDTKSDSFATDLENIFDNIKETDFKAALQKVADKESDAQEIIDGIDADADCADVLFSGSDDLAEAPTPTPRTKTVTAAKPSPTPKARTTVKPNSSVNEKWVIGVCVATQSFTDDIEYLSDSLNFDTVNDPAELKQMMVDFLDDTASRSEQFKREIDRLPTPDVKDGRKIQAAMSDAAGQVVTLFKDSARDARKLDAGNTTKLMAGLDALGSNLNAASTDIEDAFSQIDQDYDTTELSRIANKVPECAGLFN